MCISTISYPRHQVEVYNKLTDRPLYLRVGTPLATNQEHRWASETAWKFWRREKPLPPVGNHQIFQSVTNSLYWIRCPAFRKKICLLQGHSETCGHPVQEILSYVKNWVSFHHNFRLLQWHISAVFKLAPLAAAQLARPWIRPRLD